MQLALAMKPQGPCVRPVFKVLSTSSSHPHKSGLLAFSHLPPSTFSLFFLLPPPPSASSRILRGTSHRTLQILTHPLYSKTDSVILKEFFKKPKLQENRERLTRNLNIPFFFFKHRWLSRAIWGCAVLCSWRERQHVPPVFPFEMENPYRWVAR